jgi:hypothetical protein
MGAGSIHRPHYPAPPNYVRMLGLKQKVKLAVRCARKASLTALPILAAFAFAFYSLSRTNPASGNFFPLSPTAPAVPVSLSMVGSLSNSQVKQYPESLAIPDKPVVAAWEWAKRGEKPEDYFSKRILHIHSSESRAYFRRLAGCGINRLYLQVGAKGGRLTYNESYLAGFLRRAKQKGIEVYALFGKPSFARTENHAKANAIVKAILRHNALHPDAAFAGIQSDIEPYYEFTGSGTTRPTDLRVTGPQYVAEIEDQRELVDGYNEEMGRRLKLEAAIPFWYDIPAEKRRTGRKPFRFVFNGFDGTIADQVIRLTDSVAVMSYRNNDVGEDGVSGVARYVVDAVRRYNRRHNTHKKVVIGLETNKPGRRGVTRGITVHKMAWKTLRTRILQRLGRRYREKPTVEGVAYNHTVPLFEMQARWAENDPRFRYQ